MTTTERTKKWREAWQKRDLDGYRKWDRERKQRYRTVSPEIHQAKDLRSDLRKLYKMTVEEYEKKAQEQNNLCAICQQPEPRYRRLAVDHDHETGENRGLLCSNCNPGLGMFQEDILRLQAAIEYVKKYKGAS